MKLGIVSDTHGHLPGTRRAVELLAAEDVEAVLHCGDIGSVEVVSLFDRWPTQFVFGNVDHDEQELREAIELAGQTCHGRFGDFTLGGVRIALIHGDDHRRLRAAVSSGEYGLICYGHTHLSEHHHERETLVLNPGALYRANPRTFAIVELPARSVRRVALDH